MMTEWLTTDDKQAQKRIQEVKLEDNHALRIQDH